MARDEAMAPVTGGGAKPTGGLYISRHGESAPKATVQLHDGEDEDFMSPIARCAARNTAPIETSKPANDSKTTSWHDKIRWTKFRKAQRNADETTGPLETTSTTSNTENGDPKTASPDAISAGVRHGRKGKQPDTLNTNEPLKTHLMPPNLRLHLDQPGPSDWSSRLLLDHATYPNDVLADRQAQEKLRQAAKAEYCSAPCKHATRNCEFVEVATLKERKRQKKANGLWVRFLRKLAGWGLVKKKKKTKPTAVKGKNGWLPATSSGGETDGVKKEAKAKEKSIRSD